MKYVTKFVKRHLIHASDFSTLKWNNFMAIKSKTFSPICTMIGKF